MKLWLKIFLSILLLSLTTLFISTWFVINKNHINNLNREQERSLNELELIRISLESNVDFTSSSIDSIKTIINRYGEYYGQKGIYLLLYQDNEYIYNQLKTLDTSSYETLLSVTLNHRMVQVLNGGTLRYMLVSDLLSEKNRTVLLYCRDINEIYEARNQSIKLIFSLALLLSVILGIISYYYSRWLTRPLAVLQKGAKAVASGDYSIRITETDSDFSSVAEAFNQMAGNVNRHTRELKERARERQEFIDDLSHEMNTPLTSIQGYSEFLLSANATEVQKRRAVQNIHTDAKRMREMYDKLMALTFAREHALLLYSVNIPELLDTLKESFKPTFIQHQIVFKAETTLETLKADRILLQMLLTNLINNSLQAVQSGGMIHLLAYEKENKPVIEVTDNGCGIPKDKITEIIKPFVRVDKSRSRKTGGAGLGLALVSRIADLHKAEILIDSELGKGTTVRIIFSTSMD
ncbi:two-component sensor histidine kinase [Anaerocolumna cellulosilytica]|uniref:histidine kinase n=1 Tax=Anaerocolumna cellulosilytica TaxID=433286 RepID=A0A6S6QX58_9FIRM|nr:HAMP domain-containing sensor histidine kinase [Anaerocolumna cellulosilytica]MBB5196805.1 signal transduction histidine kinase [Anaerocolumna cellulosilytica]BCJ95803.1 two-component sensor histidine kinase [Anaerocolumna cellulosilytica]